MYIYHLLDLLVKDKISTIFLESILVPFDNFKVINNMYQILIKQKE